MKCWLGMGTVLRCLSQAAPGGEVELFSAAVAFEFPILIPMCHFPSGWCQIKYVLVQQSGLGWNSLVYWSPWLTWSDTFMSKQEQTRSTAYHLCASADLFYTVLSVCTNWHPGQPLTVNREKTNKTFLSFIISSYPSVLSIVHFYLSVSFY